MIQKVSAMDVRKHFGDLLNDVHYRHNTVLITKAGKPMGALIDVELFEKIRLMETEFHRMTNELAKAYEGVDPIVAEAEIQEAIEALKNQ
ncbi:type II toxin-antitoxin system Phd/YefM family antitoxin (plasmid) [Alicyclobacillus sp. TC]|uniref:Antitoxin n=2 Tax=Alicyclobacillus tolerans TaxID=90970 RepID=A0A1M6UE95_9BACL|nr:MULTISPECIES: type II toxin-antitoxin system Phd/YefM family antitoxin [Alicyclobacillus]MDP9729899.1 prevent-host-death family protein [Alicyclobacillus tengchongensis]QRF24898.1 type II toxin-antitoxin system Phd/YefM family antitoxin [Alicyclobacillus sp. TC]SHK67497.1 prevent-host-death family protein [Alicyclobacillus montanus]